ncbi:MAG: hypothetical protein K6B67_05635 [Lachnospiraceae bacterium]|nr:hypothetical protein [Lachnospiraceae bacterium]
MSELTIIMTMGLTIGVIFFIIGIRNRDAVFAFIGAVFLSAGGALGIALAVHQLSHGVVEDLSKLSKEIENKEIVSIEMEDPVITYNTDSTDSIETITYIDDNGDKTKIDCSDFNLPEAHVKESDDKKYHITIIEDGRITVYIPKNKEYTSK